MPEPDFHRMVMPPDTYTWRGWSHWFQPGWVRLTLIRFFAAARMMLTKARQKRRFI